MRAVLSNGFECTEEIWKDFLHVHFISGAVQPVSAWSYKIEQMEQRGKSP